MRARYIIRLDDIAPTMAWESYFRLKQIFRCYEVKPLFGVIPDNNDRELCRYPLCKFDFWDEIRSVRSDGWEIAMHGYRHEYVTQSAGILGVSHQSEFAGLPYEIQLEKLRKAKEILDQQMITTDVFMAPSHSFDENTLKAIKALGFRSVTDGWALYPYWYKDLLFVPQLFAKPRRLPFGIYSFCIHLNTSDESFFAYLGSFLKHYHKQVISFSHAHHFVSRRFVNRAVGLAAKGTFSLYKTWRKGIK